MTALAAEPMEEAALEFLAALLDERAWPHGGMSLEMLDGFFSALVVGPELVPPSEYLPHVWGEAPEWETMAQAQQGIESAMRFWNHIVWRVGQPIPEEPGSFEDEMRLMPCFALPEGVEEDGDGDDLSGVPDDFPLAGLWAAGFQHGMQLRLEAWADRIEAHEDFAEDLSRVHRLSVLNREHARELGLPEEEEVLDFRQRLEETLHLPQMLEQMYLQALDDRRPQPIRRDAAPGRNEPCPCGSGKKYKKCCGGAATLH